MVDFVRAPKSALLTLRDPWAWGAVLISAYIPVLALLAVPVYAVYWYLGDKAYQVELSEWIKDTQKGLDSITEIRHGEIRVLDSSIWSLRVDFPGAHALRARYAELSNKFWQTHQLVDGQIYKR